MLPKSVLPRSMLGASGRTSFQPMCGTLILSSFGSSRFTSPAIQSRPAVSPNSSPRVARSCMPTQMPRKGAPRVLAASVIASTMPSRACSAPMQAAKAPTPGSTTRSALATTSASEVVTISCPPESPAAALRSAFSAERRLPEP